jgi:hypothetical protein
MGEYAGAVAGHEKTTLFLSLGQVVLLEFFPAQRAGFLDVTFFRKVTSIENQMDHVDPV